MSSIRSRAPAASSGAVRRTMQAVPGRDTRAETVLRSALFRRGLRFRKNCRPIENVRISADVVFFGERVCVFVDGCFWHGCKLHKTKAPKTHRDFWQRKIKTNTARDRRVRADLRRHGWNIVRLWEHDAKDDLYHILRSKLKSAV